MKINLSPEETKEELKTVKKEILKASVLWDIYALNFGVEYAEKHTHYTRKMFDDDLKTVQIIEKEITETAP